MADVIRGESAAHRGARVIPTAVAARFAEVVPRTKEWMKSNAHREQAQRITGISVRVLHCVGRPYALEAGTPVDTGAFGGCVSGR